MKRSQLNAMSIELWPIDRPKDYPKNARKWSGQAVEKVASSIREYGWRQPVVVDANDVIVIGHLRRAAGKFLGLTEIPVHVARDLTPAQIRGLRLADNRTNQEASWDETLLALEISELDGLDFDLSLTGFNVNELDSLLRDPLDEEKAEQAPPLPEVAVTQPGDLWLIGPHRVFCGDATSKDAVARLLGEKKPLLLVTDPPYGIELDSEWRDRAGLNKHGPAQASYMKHRTEGHRNTSISSDTRADWSEAFALVPSLQVGVCLARVRSSRARFSMACCGLASCIISRSSGTRAELCSREHHIGLHTNRAGSSGKRTPRGSEKPARTPRCGTVASPKFIMGGSDEAKFDHPTQKPLELMRRPILNHIKRGDIVFDPFLGSGTTLMAAELTERVCYGIELDPKYCDVIVQRWQQFVGLEATLDGTNRTFDDIAAERVPIVA